MNSRVKKPLKKGCLLPQILAVNFNLTTTLILFDLKSTPNPLPIKMTAPSAATATRLAIEPDQRYDDWYQTEALVIDWANPTAVALLRAECQQMNLANNIDTIVLNDQLQRLVIFYCRILQATATDDPGKMRFLNYQLSALRSLDTELASCQSPSDEHQRFLDQLDKQRYRQWLLPRHEKCYPIIPSNSDSREKPGLSASAGPGDPDITLTDLLEGVGSQLHLDDPVLDAV
ncbi:hypothetical protein FALBO_12578 [Fusarium albosuccineum]|uniref:Uncharacterized protein n=1 Tax=Fusarium albosuccineum TaxID=1237068 RepID=A0A8H4P303_9HYPO|nr:hypothetical protein FALBO_12578 [Fusarium albosuccineum]